MADNFGLKIGLEGEKEFKKALSEINSNFKVLGSEMKLVASQFDKNDNSVQALTARNQVLNKEIEAQKQKIDTLRSALQNAAESFGENDKRTQNWQIQLNNAEATLNDMEREVAKNEAAIDSMGDEMGDAEGQTEKFADAVEDSGEEAEEAGGKFEKFRSVLSTIGKATAAVVTAIGTAAIAAGKALWDMSTSVAQAGDEIQKTSQKVGLSYEAYQKWDYAMKICGTEMSSCTTGLKTLTNTFDDASNGSASAIEKFERLGLSVDQLSGMSREDMFATVVTALQNVEDETEKAALANDMFGKSGQNLLPLFNMTQEELQQVMDECENYGMVMSDEAVEASAAFQDSLTKLQGTMTGLKNNIVGEMLPGIQLVMDGLSDLAVGNEQAGEEIKSGVESVIGAIQGLIPQAVELLSMIAAAVLSSAPSIIQALAQGVIDSMPILIPVVLQVVNEIGTVLISLLPQLVEAGMQILESLALGIAEALPELAPQMVQVVTQIVQSLVDNLPLLLDAGLQLILGLVEGLLAAIPALIEALPSIITAIVEFIIGAIPQIIDAGIQLLTSLVTALPEIITAVVAAIPQIVDGLVTAILGSIPQLIDAGVKLLVSLIQNLPAIITAVVAAIPQIVTSLVTAIVGSIPQLVQAGVQLFVALIQNLPTIITQIVAAVPQILAGLVSAFGKGVSQLANVGKQLVQGLWNGIQSLASWLWNKVSGWISGIWGGIKNFFGIHSPSKQMAWIGEMLVKGLSGSIEDNGDEAVKAAEGMAKDINGVMGDLAADMQTALPTDFSLNGTAAAVAGGAGVGASGGLSLQLSIATFNNYSSEDIEQLTNEIMVTAGQFAKRKGLVFA